MPLMKLSATGLAALAAGAALLLSPAQAAPPSSVGAGAFALAKAANPFAFKVWHGGSRDGDRDHRGEGSRGHDRDRYAKDRRDGARSDHRRDGHYDGRRHDDHSRYSDHRRHDDRHYYDSRRTYYYSRGPGYRPHGHRHGYGPRRGHGYYCNDHRAFHYYAGYDPYGWVFAVHVGYRPPYGCRTVERVVYRGYRRIVYGAVQCIDDWGYPYILSGSKYVYRTY